MALGGEKLYASADHSIQSSANAISRMHFGQPPRAFILLKTEDTRKRCAFDGRVASELSSCQHRSSPYHAPVWNTLRPLQLRNVEPCITLPGSNVQVEEKFSVAGGCKLSGHVHISGAKNSALAVLAGSLCAKAEVHLKMVPNLLDIQQMLHVLRSLGVYVRQCGSDIFVNASTISSAEPCGNSIQTLRAGFFVVGALVARHGEAVMALPGGCDIGARPVDLHLSGLEALGATVEVRHGVVHARVADGKRLKGGNFHLSFPSVGATETLMMAACLADGETTLLNVAQEPEVVDLARFLVSCGARIQGAGTRRLVIKGVRNLHGTEYAINPDRVEAGTFLIAAAITRSAISMSPVVPHQLQFVIKKLTSIGCTIHEQHGDMLLISPSSVLRGLEVATGPYPGFPTDLQPQMMSLLTTCNGESVVEETIFENRMGHVEELKKMGAKISIYRRKASIFGRNLGSLLQGSSVKAKDLRAGAALIVAGMAAEGITHIEGAKHVDRGYERFDDKLRLLGANIKRFL